MVVIGASPQGLATISTANNILEITPNNLQEGTMTVKWEVRDYQGTVLLEGTMTAKIKSLLTIQKMNLVGTRDALFLYALTIGNETFIVEKESQNPNPDAFFPRGSNILDSSGVTITGTLPTITPNVTAYNGLACPTSFPATFAGYVRKTKPDRAVYYEVVGDANPPVATALEGGIIGSRNGANVVRRTYGGKVYACEMKSISPDAFFPRGHGLVAGLTHASTDVSMSGMDTEDSTFGGLGTPAGFPASINGYVKKTTADGAIYFEAGTATPLPPSPVPSSGIIGMRGSATVIRRTYGGKDWALEVKSTSPDAFFPRGYGVLASLTHSSTDVSTSGISTEDSSYGGLGLPASFPTSISGYTKKTTADGAVYFEADGTIQPIDPTVIRALVSDEIVGTRGGKNLKTKLYGNHWFILEERTSSPESFIVRGRNIVTNGDVTLSKSVSASQLAGEDTGFGGLTMTPLFSTPTGYTQKTEVDGAVYYEKNTTVATPPVNPVTYAPPAPSAFTQTAPAPTDPAKESWFKRNATALWIGGTIVVIGASVAIYYFVFNK